MHAEQIGGAAGEGGEDREALASGTGAGDFASNLAERAIAATGDQNVIARGDARLSGRTRALFGFSFGSVNAPAGELEPVRRALNFGLADLRAPPRHRVPDQKCAHDPPRGDEAHIPH
jgi:hypothetical protein